MAKLFPKSSKRGKPFPNEIFGNTEKYSPLTRHPLCTNKYDTSRYLSVQLERWLLNQKLSIYLCVCLRGGGCFITLLNFMNNIKIVRQLNGNTNYFGKNDLVRYKNPSSTIMFELLWVMHSSLYSLIWRCQFQYQYSYIQPRKFIAQCKATVITVVILLKNIWIEKDYISFDLVLKY